MLVMVPDCLRDDINRELDAALVDCPEATGDRDVLYQQILTYFHEHGVLPEFSIQRRTDHE